jgi:hypothetical protein
VVLKQILEECGIGMGGIEAEEAPPDLQRAGAGSGHRVLVFAQLKGLLVRGCPVSLTPTPARVPLAPPPWPHEE